MSNATRFDSIFRPDLFAGQVHLVTGGGTGLGRCIAHELAALGAHVIVAARREEPLQQVTEEIRAAGGAASWTTLNIREDERVDEAVADIVATHGRLDGVVNNGGGQFAAPAALIRPKGWRAVIDTNLNGTWYVCQAAFRHHMRDHGGAIVNIVADMWNGFPSMAHTGAARAGVVNLTKSLAVEWAPCHVRVNSVAPGFILTSGLSSYPPAVAKMAREAFVANPSGRPGSESEVSAAVIFLLSPAASYITGDTVRVDGASSLQKQPLMPLVRAHASPMWDGFHLEPELPDLFVSLRRESLSAGAGEDGEAG